MNLVQAATSSRKRKATEPAPMTLPRPLSNPPLLSYNSVYIDQTSGVPVLGVKLARNTRNNIIHS